MRIIYVTHHRVSNKYFITVYEIKTYSVGNECEGKDASAHKTTGIKNEIVEEVVQSQHQHCKSCSNQHSIESSFNLVQNQSEKRDMICDKRECAENHAFCLKSYWSFQ